MKALLYPLLHQSLAIQYRWNQHHSEEQFLDLLAMDQVASFRSDRGMDRHSYSHLP